MAKVSNQGQPQKQILDQTRFLWMKRLKKCKIIEQKSEFPKIATAPSWGC